MIAVLFVSPDVVAVCKPEGTASIPERAGDSACAQALVGAELGERVYAVHRLDKDVSGVLLFARNAEAHRHLNDAFAARRVLKQYLAVVHGSPPADVGRIDAPLREFGSGRMGVDPEVGKASETDFVVLERGPAWALVRLVPRTGRRHQLRVHCYHAGHPIVGDRRYGPPAAQRAYPRLMLHAERIAVDAGGGLAPVDIYAPPSPSFLAAWEALRADGVGPAPQ